MIDNDRPTDSTVSRRAFTRLTALAALAALLDACSAPPTAVTAAPTSTPTSLPAATLPPPDIPPTATAAPPSPPPTVDAADLYADITDRTIRQIAALIQSGQPPRARLVVRPLDQEAGELNFGGGEFQRAASTLKALILLYALFKNPALDLSPARSSQIPAADAYRMIVSSNNGATARVLVNAVPADDAENAFNSFNDFLHNILLLPPTVGLTRWNYFPTEGITTNRLSMPITDEFPTGIPNPITLNVLADFYELLETPDALANAAARASGNIEYYDADIYPTRSAYQSAVLLAVERGKRLLSIPDPDYETQMDFALADAQARHPDLAFSLYGKNGTISPADWDLNRWHINESVVLTVADETHNSRIIIAFSASSFATAAMLGAAIDYGVELFQTGA